MNIIILGLWQRREKMMPVMEAVVLLLQLQAEMTMENGD
jgi:hypothetical protein